MSEIDEDEPVAQYMKVVHVLRCKPGYARAPMEGIPIAIVTLEHNMEVEQPLMLKLKEAKLLAHGLIRALAHHGDEQAKQIVTEHLGKSSD